ncbi:MAG: DNA mismatch repair protein MutT [Candidatus Rokuibacteriota bacterium]|nr:MAG: DNA mismatch repair protein MutT [Candidatus Rokubacteria bacterium]
MTRLTRLSYSRRLPAVTRPSLVHLPPARQRRQTLEMRGSLITLVIPMNERAIVRAAGGVIIRQSTQGNPEVLLIHRSRRDDWTFPKGKLEPGESLQACALREVEEETGLRCLLEEALPPTSHVDHKGRLKIVRYWVMRPFAGDAEARYDVDLVRWLPLRRAARLLTYKHDRALLDSVIRGRAVARPGLHAL